MPDVTQNIFREKSLRRYLEERKEPVLPPLTGRWIFAWLWLAVVLLLAGGFGVYLRVMEILAHG
jgi:hypothetical protein